MTYMRASGYHNEEATSILNQMLHKIYNTKITRSTVLYVGHVQWRAMHCIEKGDPRELSNDRFEGIPVIRVMKDNWFRVGS